MKVFDSELYDGGLLRDGIIFSVAFLVTLLFTIGYSSSTVWLLLIYIILAAVAVCWTVQSYKLQFPMESLVGPLYVLVGLCYAFCLPVTQETEASLATALKDGQFFSRLLYYPAYSLFSAVSSGPATCYLTRIISVLISGAIVWFSVQTVTYGETIVALICLLPSSLYHVCSGNAVGTSLLLSVLFISLAIRVSYTKSFYVMTNRYRFALLLSAFLMVFSDLACLAFLAFLFMIPSRCYGEKKKLISFISILVICLLVIIGYRVYTTSNYPSSVFSKSDIFVSQIIQRPVYFVLSLGRTFFADGGRYLLNLLVPSPDKLSVIPWPMILAFVVSLVYTVYFDSGLSPKRFFVIRCTLISSIFFTLVIATKGYLFAPEFSSGLIDVFNGSEFLPAVLPGVYLVKRLFKHPAAAQKNLSFAVLICILANIATALFLV